MELSQAIKERRSIRKFKDEAVSHEVLSEIVELARFAPSWKNTQVARYIVVEDKEAKEKLASDECTYNFAFNQNTIKGAAALVVLTYVEGRSGFDKDGSFSTPKEDRWQNFDCGLAAMNFCLAAYEKGVGSVILGYFDDKAIKEVIAIPEGQSVGALIAIGYPDEAPAPTKRKEVADLLSFI